FSVTATDACNNKIAKTVVYTWSVASAPVFENCTSGSTDLGCNPATIPGCDGGVKAHNECGSVAVVCGTPLDSIDRCSHARTITYTATACGLSSTCTRTYTWKVDTTPPMLN